jgi:phospholipase C
VWDEWGGWYDHVLPHQYPDPQIGAYEGLGYRIPLLIISPYAKAGHISHQPHEIASTLHFIEQTFSLPPLGRGRNISGRINAPTHSMTRSTLRNSRSRSNQSNS